MNIRDALKGQYHAALAMLKQTITDCPDDLWNAGPFTVPFWRVVYHTLYFTDLYLHQRIEDFRPWEHHRGEHHDLPWPADSATPISDPYSKSDMLEYWQVCDGKVDRAVDALDLDAPESGFPWHKTVPKLEHQLHNIRHIQHHLAILSGRLRPTNGIEIRWVRSATP